MVNEIPQNEASVADDIQRFMTNLPAELPTDPEERARLVQDQLGKERVDRQQLLVAIEKEQSLLAIKKEREALSKDTKEQREEAVKKESEEVKKDTKVQREKFLEDLKQSLSDPALQGMVGDIQDATQYVQKSFRDNPAITSAIGVTAIVGAGYALVKAFKKGVGVGLGVLASIPVIGGAALYLKNKLEVEKTTKKPQGDNDEKKEGEKRDDGEKRDEGEKRDDGEKRDEGEKTDDGEKKEGEKKEGEKKEGEKKEGEKKEGEKEEGEKKEGEKEEGEKKEGEKEEGDDGDKGRKGDEGPSGPNETIEYQPIKAGIQLLTSKPVALEYKGKKFQVNATPNGTLLINGKQWKLEGIGKVKSGLFGATSRNFANFIIKFRDVSFVIHEGKLKLKMIPEVLRKADDPFDAILVSSTVPLYDPSNPNQEGYITKPSYVEMRSLEGILEHVTDEAKKKSTYRIDDYSSGTREDSNYMLVP